MSHVALITAKGGSRSLPDKNIVPIAGRPCLAHPILAAQASQYVDRVFVSTEDDRIGAVAEEYGAEVIDRPVDLAQPLTNHGDVILHGARAIADRHGEPDTVTVLLGNTVMLDGAIIDAAIERTMADDHTDSAMTVWVAQDDHPYRALTIDRDGYLRPFLSMDRPDTNRQSYPEVVFYDQGPWTVRFRSLLRSATTKEGPGPWWWMGANSAAIERPWVTGRDIHTEFDRAVSDWWLTREDR